MLAEKDKCYTIVGAGLVGSLLSIGLKKLGYAIEVVEKRSNPCTQHQIGNRSINLALSHRGITAIASIAPDLAKQVIQHSVPMYGRTIHTGAEEVFFQAYGLENECIYSVHRQELNVALITYAQLQQVQFVFDTAFDIQATHDTFVIAADGVHSTVRKHYEKLGKIHSEEYTLDYGYIEIDIPKDKGHLIKGNRESLHIWPRKNFMLIALPNRDGSYTATLFLPFKGNVSFESLANEEMIETFYSTYFPDITLLFDSIARVHQSAPVSQLTYIKSKDWCGENYMLIGDAAHGIVPFYGQGMNAGFEDVQTFLELLQSDTTRDEVFARYYQERKSNSDAILQMALDNFIEMRDSVSQPIFQLKKKVENFLYHSFPLEFVSAYRMVSFTSIPYSNAYHFAKVFEEWFQKEICSIEGIEQIEEDVTIQVLVKEKYTQWRNVLLTQPT
jgi:kynurenine 3-monooxygenase